VKKFRYIAHSERGVAAKGKLNAADRAWAVRKLQQQGLIIENLEEIRDDKAVSLPDRDLCFVYRQLSTMHGVGVTLTAALEILADSEPNPRFRGMYHTLLTSLRNGYALSEAMDEFPYTFRRSHVAMITVGETTGELTKVLNHLANLTQESVRLTTKVKAALTYPIFLLFAAFGMLVLSFVFILPQIISLIRDLHVPMPMATRVVIGLSAIWQDPKAVMMLLTAIVGATIWLRDEDHRQMLALLLERPPLAGTIVGTLVHKVALARALQLLSSMHGTGVNLANALPMAGAACGSVTLSAAFERMSKAVTRGVTLADSMHAEFGMFPSMVTAYVSVGEEAGDLTHMMKCCSDMLATEANDMLEKVPELIEPIIIVVLGVVVGFILLAVFLPLYSVLQGL